MDTDINYLYEDKYYENAVKNLKSAFYDVVEREELMLNNLENRIARETNGDVKARLLDLWSRQNDSLDQCLVIFSQLKQSVRVIDSFVRELSELDQVVVSNIINSNNYDNENMVNQEVVSQPVEEEVVTEVVEEQPVEEPSITEEIVEENVKQNVVEENNEEQVIKSLGEDEVTEENTDVISIETNEVSEEDQKILETNVETDEIKFDEVPEMEIVNEDNDGMDLPDVVEADKIDLESINEDKIEINFESEEVVEVPSTEKDTEEPVIESNIESEEKTAEEPVIESNIESEETAAPVEEKIVEESNESQVAENSKRISVGKVAKEDNNLAKAIIVNDVQYNKLHNSLSDQEDKLFTRGYLSADLINNSNEVLGKNDNANLDQIVEDVVENPTKEDLEKMIEKAAQLYTSGKKEEAQALYAEITRINDAMQQQDAPSLVKVA